MLLETFIIFFIIQIHNVNSNMLVNVINYMFSDPTHFDNQSHLHGHNGQSNGK